MSKQYEQDKQKYEREIEEILAKYEREAERRKPPEPPPSRYGNFSPSARRGPSKSSTSWRSLSAGQYMLLAFGVALLALFVRSISAPVAGFLVIVSAVLFLVPILLYWSGGSAGGGSIARDEKRWRGQVIDFNTRRDITNDPLASIKRWFRRR